MVKCKRQINYALPITLVTQKYYWRQGLPIRLLTKIFQICGEDRYYNLDQTQQVHGAASAFAKQELMGES